ncbi:MAG: hypothetical protein Q9227_009180 [Pyrenula ochraceoflavens]
MSLNSEELGMIVTNSIFVGLALFAVTLRLYVRKSRQMGFRADDYLIIVSWLIAAGLATSNIVGVPLGGFGLPFPQLSNEKATQFLKVSTATVCSYEMSIVIIDEVQILFVQQFWYIFAVAFVKFSVLCLYGRLFTQQGRYPIVVLVFLGIVGGWLIAFFFATLFQVYPIWCNWTYCPTPLTDYSLMYALCSATDIALDICILGIPAFFIRKLHLNRTQKVGLIGIFGIGIFCVVASTVRLAYTIVFIQGDPTSNFEADFGPAIVATIMWSGIEASWSIICACLPTYWPLIRESRSLIYVRASFKSVSSLFSSFRTTSKTGSKSSAPHGGPYPKGGSGAAASSTEQIVKTEIHTGNTHPSSRKGPSWLSLRGEEDRDERDIELGAIKVETRMSAVTDR